MAIGAEVDVLLSSRGKFGQLTNGGVISQKWSKNTELTARRGDRVSKKKTTVALSVQESRIKKSATYMVKLVADEDIDDSDIPKLSEEQLRKFRLLSKKKRKLLD